MNRDVILSHQFVEFVPEKLQEGIIYISIEFATAAHTCCCGCGNEVITPFSPTDWKLIFDGQTITLDPSIGNWNFPCQSHYWIRQSRTQWAQQWTQKEINAGRNQDRLTKALNTLDKDANEGKRRKGFWDKIMKWFS